MRLIEPDWPRPARVRACVTTRQGGVSAGPFASLNLATHVGDDPASVTENRRRLRAALALDAEPAWLDQVHGVDVTQIDETYAGPVSADAAWTCLAGRACAIMSADCLPILFADDQGSCVAAAHAGWRGLAAGVLERTIASLPVPAFRLGAWIGPAIGPAAFEVGPEVHDAFRQSMAVPAGAFVPSSSGRYLCDLYALVRARLAMAGIARIHGGTHCTYADPEKFFSYRRDGECGRIATLVWLD